MTGTDVQESEVDPTWAHVLVRTRPFLLALRWLKQDPRGEYVAYLSQRRDMDVYLSDHDAAFEFKLRFG